MKPVPICGITYRRERGERRKTNHYFIVTYRRERGERRENSDYCYSADSAASAVNHNLEEPCQSVVSPCLTKMKSVGYDPLCITADETTVRVSVPSSSVSSICGDLSSP